MKCSLFFAVLLYSSLSLAQTKSWIRINQLGYSPQSKKLAVWCSKHEKRIATFQLIDSATKKVIYTAKASKPFGAYGPFNYTYRLDFSTFTHGGIYFLKAGTAVSPYFRIDENVYKGTANFALRYMRQQRSGFNPFLKDSCHTQDGYALYGEKAGLPDSTFIDVAGGWHDASDYLQYATTSANATYHLLMAHRDFKKVFTDEKSANGSEGSNGHADVLDEAKWGLDWLVKMHPRKDWMFNQIADDRDHQGMRIPKMDSFYGKGYQRPVYFITGEPQGLFKYKNRTTGTSSTAAKFASAFALGAQTFFHTDVDYSNKLMEKSVSALDYSLKKMGVTQTAPGRAPYFYEEDNWSDDVELAFASYSKSLHQMLHRLRDSTAELSTGISSLNTAFHYAQQEKITPWLGADTAKHYQWYPFINIGHYELAKQLSGPQRDTIISYYKKGIQLIWNKATKNAFYRGVPFIWCSNNLTTSFAIQCYWYKQLTGDKTFEELEAANFDWLFGLNPWGTSMVYGLPSTGDTPIDPHSAFTHLKNYPIDGGLIDGPVSGSIYKNLIGITLHQPDEYAEFQSKLAVYHDDYGDYSTNEPTMDGTASLIYLLAAKEAEAATRDKKADSTFHYSHGAIIRGDSTKKNLSLVFTGDEFADGGQFIRNTLNGHKVKAAFFLTGRFYRNPDFKWIIQNLKKDGHYLGAHSNEHLLYADWRKRDSLLVSKDQFTSDLLKNYEAMKPFGIQQKAAPYFLPPYEWYNDTIAAWTKNLQLRLINYTPGSLSHADYTTPSDKNYRSSEVIFNSIRLFEEKSTSGLNGFLLLMHIGTDGSRTDKYYHYLPRLLNWVKEKDYNIVPLKQLFNVKQD